MLELCLFVFSALIDYITSGPIIVFEIVNTNAVDNWREAIGPTDPSRARTVAPTSIRAQYGIGMCCQKTCLNKKVLNYFCFKCWIAKESFI